jgi:hypothetical protein
MFREMIQNANDAGATEITFDFKKSCGKDGFSATSNWLSGDNKPGCLIVKDNGAGFEADGWDRLRTIASGNPSPDKVGGFGVGFYSVFHFSDEPMVKSNGVEMHFTWSNDKLLIDRVDGSKFWKSGTTGSEFNLPLRNVTGAMEECDKFHFLSYLVRALSFTRSLTTIKVTGLPIASEYIVTKQLVSKDAVTLPGSSLFSSLSNVKTPDGIFGINSAVTRLEYAMQTKAITAEGEFESEGNFIIADAEATTLQYGKKNGFNRYILDKTGKPNLPKSVTVSLLFQSGMDAWAAQWEPCDMNNLMNCAMVSKADRGNIFVGFQTQQTTGTGYHLNAPFFATMDRESVEMDQNPIGMFNSDLIWLGGHVARYVYQAEIERALPEPEAIEDLDYGWLFDDHGATQTLQAFSIDKSAPMPGIASVISAGFFAVEEPLKCPCVKATREQAKLYTKGFKVSIAVHVDDCAKVRQGPILTAEQREGTFSFIRAGFMPAYLGKFASDWVNMLRNKNILQYVNADDILSSVPKIQPMDMAGAKELLSWVTSSRNVIKHDVSNFKHVTGYMNVEPETILATMMLSTIDHAQKFCDNTPGCKAFSFGSRTPVPEEEVSCRFHSKLGPIIQREGQQTFSRTNELEGAHTRMMKGVLKKLTICADEENICAGSTMSHSNKTLCCTDLKDVEKYFDKVTPFVSRALPMPPAVLPPSIHLKLRSLGFKNFNEEFLLQEEGFEYYWRFFTARYADSITSDMAYELLKVLDHTNIFDFDLANQTVVELIQKVRCIPTASGKVVLPQHAYFPDVKAEGIERVGKEMFDTHRVSEKLLLRLGVKKRLEVSALLKDLHPNKVTPEFSASIVSTVVALGAALTDEEVSLLMTTRFMLSDLQVKDSKSSDELPSKLPHELHMPSAEHSQLGLPVVYSKGAVEKSGANGVFERIGVMVEPTWQTLVTVASDETHSTQALTYMERKWHSIYTENKTLIYESDKKFVPTQLGLQSPKSCFINEGNAHLGYPVVNEQFAAIAVLMGVERDPSLQNAITKGVGLLQEGSTKSAGRTQVLEQLAIKVNKARTQKGVAFTKKKGYLNKRHEITRAQMADFRHAKEYCTGEPACVGFSFRLKDMEWVDDGTPEGSFEAMFVSASTDFTEEDDTDWYSFFKNDVATPEEEVILRESKIVSSASGEKVVAEQGFAATHADILTAFQTVQTTLRLNDTFPDECTAAMFSTEMIVDHGENANSFLQSLGATSIRGMESEEFFGKILLQYTSTFLEHELSYHCVLAVLSTLSEERHAQTIASLKAAPSVIAFDRQNAMAPKMVKPSACYFEDSADLVALANPRYFCPADFTHSQEAYIRLGSQYLSDALVSKGTENNRQQEQSSSDRAKRYEKTLKTRQNVIGFAMKQKLKYNKADRKQKDEILKSCNQILLSIQVKEVSDLEEEIWFEDRLLETRESSAVYEENGNVLAITNNVSMTALSFQLASAITKNALAQDGVAKHSLGIVRDFATTIIFVLSSSYETLQQMHYITDEEMAEAQKKLKAYQNYAVGKIAKQSTSDSDSPASNAVDGDLATYAVTEDAGVNWWLVDLGVEMFVKKVAISAPDVADGRPDWTQEMSVFAGSNENPLSNPPCSNSSISVAQGEKGVAPCNAYGRYVVISKKGRLALAEVLVSVAETEAKDEPDETDAEMQKLEQEREARELREKERLVREQLERKVEALRREAEEKAKKDEEVRKKEEDERAKEEKARQAEETARRDAEEKARKAAEEKARKEREVAEKARQEAMKEAETARQEAMKEANNAREETAKVRREAEAKQRQSDNLEKQRKQAEAQATRDAESKKKNAQREQEDEEERLRQKEVAKNEREAREYQRQKAAAESKKKFHGDELYSVLFKELKTRKLKADADVVVENRKCRIFKYLFPVTFPVS